MIPRDKPCAVSAAIAFSLGKVCASHSLASAEIALTGLLALLRRADNVSLIVVLALSLGTLDASIAQRAPVVDDRHFTTLQAVVVEKANCATPDTRLSSSA